tara:strand:- start:186 stop:389 length:204 start_codon:yes stop_codon:yes gene_type:complete
MKYLSTSQVAENYVPREQLEEALYSSSQYEPVLVRELIEAAKGLCEYSTTADMAIGEALRKLEASHE